MSKDIPEFCDYHCPHAEFPPADTAGICRTMSAVWCGKLSALTNKNMPCAWREAGGEQAKSAGRGRSARKTKTAKKRTGSKKKSASASGKKAGRKGAAVKKRK